MLHKTALRHGRPETVRWIQLELAAMAAMAIFAFGVVDWAFLRYHVVAMVVGQSFSAFFAVWTVHHDCDREHYIARTIRNPFKAFVTYDMFYTSSTTSFRRCRRASSRSWPNASTPSRRS